MQFKLINDEPPKIEGQLLIKYEGNDAINHSFNVELYALSLLGFSQSFRKANRSLFGIELNVEIRAVREGSILADIWFFLEQNQDKAEIINTYIELFRNTSETCVAAGGCIFGLYKFLVFLIKKAEGKKDNIKKIIRELKTDSDLSSKLLSLLLNKSFRKYLDQFTLFLAKSDMEHVEVELPNQDTFRIVKSDRPYFVEQPEDETEVNVVTEVVSVVYVSPNRTRWRFVANKKEFWAEIADPKFIIRMHDKPLEYFENIRFEATVKTTSTLKKDSVKPEVVTEIFDFKLYNPPKQINLVK